MQSICLRRLNIGKGKISSRDSALSTGKLFFARSAYQQANHKEKLAQVEQFLGDPDKGK